MKFAKELERDAIAEWWDQYIDYKGLKKIMLKNPPNKHQSTKLSLARLWRNLNQIHPSASFAAADDKIPSADSLAHPASLRSVRILRTGREDLHHSNSIRHPPSFTPPILQKPPTDFISHDISSSELKLYDMTSRIADPPISRSPSIVSPLSSPPLSSIDDQFTKRFKAEVEKAGAFFDSKVAESKMRFKQLSQQIYMLKCETRNAGVSRQFSIHKKIALAAHHKPIRRAVIELYRTLHLVKQFQVCPFGIERIVDGVRLL